MDSTDIRSLFGLTDDELDRLVEVIVEQCGSHLSRDQFSEAVLSLFEDVAGFEVITIKRANWYIAAMWRRYRARSD